MVAQIRAPDRAPTHPGAVLREDVMPAFRRPVSEIADIIGVSRQSLHALLSEKAAMSPEMALRIGKLCGNGPEMWLQMQRTLDLWVAARKVDVSAIRTLDVA